LEEATSTSRSPTFVLSKTQWLPDGVASLCTKCSKPFSLVVRRVCVPGGDALCKKEGLCVVGTGGGQWLAHPASHVPWCCTVCGRGAQLEFGERWGGGWPVCTCVATAPLSVLWAHLLRGLCRGPPAPWGRRRPQAPVQQLLWRHPPRAKGESAARVDGVTGAVCQKWRGALRRVGTGDPKGGAWMAHPAPSHPPTHHPPTHPPLPPPTHPLTHPPTHPSHHPPTHPLDAFGPLPPPFASPTP
jgi:hypothetical protein